MNNFPTQIANRPTELLLVPTGSTVLKFSLILTLGLFLQPGRLVRAQDGVPVYAEHQDLQYYLDTSGQKAPIKTTADWQIRRTHLLAHMSDRTQ